MTAIDSFQWSKLSKREKALLAATVGALFYALIILYYKPRLMEREKLYTQKSALQQEVVALSSALPVLAQKADAVNGEAPSPADVSPVAVSSLPPGAPLSMILEEIGRQARMKEVQLIELRPSPAEQKEGYEILPVQLKTRSRFRSLGEYLAVLEQLPRPVVVYQMKIESTQETSPYILVDMTLHLYKREGV